MVYLLLVLTLACLALKGYCGKKVGVYMRDNGDAFLYNFLRMSFCLAIGTALIFIEGSQGFFGVDGRMIAISALSGVSNAAFVVCWLLAIERNTMVTVDVCLTMGSFLPAVLCLALFGDTFAWQKLIGFALILGASAILAGYNKKIKKGKTGFFGVILVILATLGDGMINFSQQLYLKFCAEGGAYATERVYPKSVFHFYTYLFAAVALGLFFLFYKLMRSSKKELAPAVDGVEVKSGDLGRAVPLIAIMAICLFAANYLQTVISGDFGMTSEVLYPVLKGGSLITVNFVAMIFFGEKITKRSIAGTLVALGGIIIINVF